MSPTAKTVWYICKDGTTYGPTTFAQLRDIADKGTLQPGDLIWRDGLADWVPARRAHSLFPKQEEQLPQTEPIATQPATNGYRMPSEVSAMASVSQLLNSWKRIKALLCAA